MVGGIFLLDIHLTSISYIVCIIGKCSLNKVLRLPYNLGLESLLKPMIHANNKRATTFNHHLKMVPKNISRTSSMMWSKQVQNTYAIFIKRKQVWWKIYRGIKQQKWILFYTQNIAKSNTHTHNNPCISIPNKYSKLLRNKNNRKFCLLPYLGMIICWFVGI